MKVNQTERWLRLIFGFAVLLFAGIIYAWSLLNRPFALSLAEGGEFGWSPAQLSLNYTITIVCFCLGGFAGGMLSGKISARARVLAAAVLLFFGFFFTSRLAPGSGAALLYVTYGVMSGLGIGFAYTTIIGLTSAWFPDKKGLCSGVLLMGFGLTSLVIGSAADAMMNSALGWRTTYLILAAAIGAILAAAAFIVRAPREGTVFPLPVKKSGKQPDAGRDYSAGEMIRTGAFWLVFAEVALVAAIGSAAIALAKNILGEFEVRSPAAIIGVISILNGVGRLASGALFDRAGVRRTQFVISAVTIAAPVVVVVGILAKSAFAGIAGLALCYFSYGFAPTISSVFTSSFFGAKGFTRNFGIMNLILVPAPFAATLSGAIYQRTQSFLIPFLILTGVAAASLFVNLAIKKPQSEGGRPS
ncbi:MAG: MFS transporter [Oscillospiraceae bacterium]|jgi:OFA family oxalate/formate antiporter-like MFS transporter|nr:MFS transporter [Oscillospiraceae bacterium]